MRICTRRTLLAMLILPLLAGRAAAQEGQEGNGARRRTKLLAF